MRDLNAREDRTGDVMKDIELERILTGDELVPSSGFTRSVMDAVLRESTAPQPIPFPWKWAVPGIIVAAVVLVVLIVAIVQSALATPEFAATDAGLRALAASGEAALRHLMNAYAAGAWTLIALLTCTASLLIPFRFARQKA